MEHRDDSLEDFEKRNVELDGTTRDVFVSGERGPGVIVMPEMPEISREVARFARWVRAPGSLSTSRRCSADLGLRPRLRTAPRS